MTDTLLCSTFRRMWSVWKLQACFQDKMKAALLSYTHSLVCFIISLIIGFFIKGGWLCSICPKLSLNTFSCTQTSHLKDIHLHVYRTERPCLLTLVNVREQQDADAAGSALPGHSELKSHVPQHFSNVDSSKISNDLRYRRICFPVL